MRLEGDRHLVSQRLPDKVFQFVIEARRQSSE